MQITQPSQYRSSQLQYRFAVISEAPSMTRFTVQVYNLLEPGDFSGIDQEVEDQGYHNYAVEQDTCLVCALP